MALPTYVGFSKTAFGASPLTVSYPAGGTSDLLIAVVSVPSNHTVSTPSGWTLFAMVTGFYRQYIFYRTITTASSGTFSVSHSANPMDAVRVWRFTDVDQSAPITTASPAINTAAQTTNAQVTSGTLTAPDNSVSLFIASQPFYSSAMTWAFPSGWTQAHEDDPYAIATKDYATSAAIAAQTLTGGPVNFTRYCAHMALKGTGGGGGGSSVTGTTALDPGSPSLTAVGRRNVAGTTLLALGSTALAASGRAGKTGAVAVPALAPALALSGVRGIRGTALGAAGAPSALLAGVRGVRGTATAAGPAPNLSARADGTLRGTASLPGPVGSLTASGRVDVHGSAVMVAGAPSVALAGSVGVRALVSIALGTPVTTAQGVRHVRGSAELPGPAPALVALGPFDIVAINAKLELALPHVWLELIPMRLKLELVAALTRLETA